MLCQSRVCRAGCGPRFSAWAARLRRLKANEFRQWCGVGADQIRRPRARLFAFYIRRYGTGSD
eukprot:scaffold266773_cov25-Prasinocladus_malaysianus.AAC.1